MKNNELSKNKNSDIETVKTSEVQIVEDEFSIENVLPEGDNGLRDNSTMTSPLMRSCFSIQQHGAHFDTETDQWRLYNSKTGLWQKVSSKSFRYFFSNAFNLQSKLSRGKSKVVPEKTMDEVWYQITLDNPVGEEWKPDTNTYHYQMPFSNGVLNLKTKVKEKFYKELMLESKLERKYDPDAGIECPNWIKLLETLSGGDKVVQKVLEAFALLSMTGKGRLERSILSLYSELGGSGKGTYMNVLQNLAGPDRAASSEISRLRDDTTLNEFESKTLIIFPEEREMLRSSSNTFARLLKMASLDTITGRAVYAKETFRYVPKAVMVFSSNVHVFPNDGAGSRRILILKTFATPPEDRDRNFGLKLEEELPTITNRLLEIFDWNPEKAATVIEEASKYEVFMRYAKENADETSSVASFLNEMIIPVGAIKHKKTISSSEYSKNIKEYKKQPIPAINILSLYRAYKNYLSDVNPNAGILKKDRFVKEVMNYYKINLGHETYLTDAAVPGLVGAPQRILGITPNPETWIDEYKMFKQ